MVGLPARGKSYISKKLVRYLAWSGFNTRVFNVGNRRTTHDAKFFDPDNPEAAATRDKLALETLEEVIEWLHRGGGKVAIHDATNSTVRRRKMLFERVRKEKGIKALFIESICTDSKVLEQNIQMKLQGPDYKNMPPEMAMRDFMARTANYEKAYQTISQEEEEEDDLGFIKLVNVGKKVIAHNVHGYLESQCVFYLMQMHIKPRTIWLTRHGESEYNVSGQIGGDPPLTDLGRRYAKALARFMRGFHPPSAVATSSTIPLSSSATIQQSQPSTATLATPSEPFKRSSSILDDDFGTDRGMSLSIWTSTLRRTFETVEWFDDEEYNIKRIKFLNEIYAGICEDLTYLQIEEIYPDEYRARQKAKLVYRYPGPGGESYVDVIERLRPIIIELERMQTNVMIVTHQVVLRTLLSYFVAVPLDQMPTLSVPLHTLYCLKPKPYGADLIKCELVGVRFD
ncbi:6-phosphofructo-2-kinase-domain-containing protein [Fimicolochytrium jonesii]|uniref:6-phosphofructo-2-kinase-domain-containing protein n=1 Tax=Fimicolochytrium jonesii TaxID=1396493 RepID=UPI0022FE738C|nr:6-phosphofructo-2-kinase-domain-containing protein [Fimicolochytrium jonesii]KAI8818889.1 6-phosphofructo-2-kinase-domain-containing protein [Fimicolochytrium jonesii]